MGGAFASSNLKMKFALLFVGVAAALDLETYVGGLTACADTEAFCLEKPTMYAGTMPTSHPTLIDTFPAITTLPTLKQTVLPMIQDTTTWKCDTSSSPVPGLSEELVYGYVAAGNHLPYCVPLPTLAGDSSSSTWMQLGYALKKLEQAVWATYYASVPTMAAEYMADDAFFGWSS